MACLPGETQANWPQQASVAVGALEVAFAVGITSNVAYLVGTDEAGYGPNLGPLVISATVWQAPPWVRIGEFYERLEGVISPSLDPPGQISNGRVTIADSKVVYQSGRGLRNLERGLWAALALLDQRPDTWLEVWHALAPASVEPMLQAPWYREYDARVPVDADPAELDALIPAVTKGMAAAEVCLVEMVSRAIFPEQFNELIERYQSKGAALSHLTLELVSDVLEPLEEGPISVVCDKHGGRDHYAPLLAERFPHRRIEVRREGPQQSIYRFGPAGHRVEIRFCTQAEAYLPAALASMASKYLRELAMQAFNDYWCDRVADLRPTAGYPEDAKRFKAAIAAVQRELGIDDRILWRMK
jgi:hypothetical protein